MDMGLADSVDAGIFDIAGFLCEDFVKDLHSESLQVTTFYKLTGCG